VAKKSGKSSVKVYDSPEAWVHWEENKRAERIQDVAIEDLPE
jgi:hypothetical protein